ncbi:MAG: ribosome silencing factor [Bacilli bacterium]|nr:ribosome silencing factor [Bacilli bacterium]
MSVAQQVQTIVQVLDDHKAENITSVDVSEFNPFASSVVIATCPNPRSLGAMKEVLDEELAKAGIEVLVTDGEPDSGWMIVATDEVIIHMLLAANRRELDLEGLLDKISHKIGKA